jgi:hypothetical protein
MWCFRSAAYAVPLLGRGAADRRKKLTMKAADPLTIVLTFPVRYARLAHLDNPPALPRHKLEAALKAGILVRPGACPRRRPTSRAWDRLF